MRTNYLLLALALLISLCLAKAADLPPSKPAPAKAEAKLKHRPFNGTIKAVSKPLRAVVLRGEKAQTFFILPETKIKRDGQPITFEQIAIGERLGGYARQAANGRWEALTLNLGDKEKKEVAPTTSTPTNAPAHKPKR